MGDAPIRIAVTGASGYLARRIIHGLESLEWVDHILATDIRPPADDFGSQKVTFQPIDVRQPMGDIFADSGVDTVVHLAYVMNPGRDRRAAWRVNVGGTANLLESCANSKVEQICYLGSTSVYGAHPDNPDCLTEDSPLRPLPGFQYSEDKAEAEALLSEFADSRPDVGVTILRVCPVFGPHADNFIASAFNKPFLVGVRGYDPPMQFIHEDDLVASVLHCLEKRVSGTFNLAGEGTIQWSEMAEVFGRRLLKLPAPIIYGLAAVGWKLRIQRDSPSCGIDFIRYRWTASTLRARQELGISMRHSAREAWESFALRDRIAEPIKTL